MKSRWLDWRGEHDPVPVEGKYEVLGPSGFVKFWKEVPYGFIDRHVVSTVLLICRAQLPGEESDGLPEVFHPLLEDGTRGGGRSVRGQGECSGSMWMSQEISSKQARFSLVEGCDECDGPRTRMGTLDFRAGKDVVMRYLDDGCEWKETPIET